MRGKTKKVYEHLERHGSITSNEAWKAYGVTRLSAIVFNLRRRGIDIETVNEECTDRYGDSSRYGRYVYHPKTESNEDSQGI